MLQSYPIKITKNRKNIIVEFPDIPEAITTGKNEMDAIAWAEDALVVALSGYLDARRDIPQPSKLKKGQKAIALPPLIASKLAIYQTMRDKKINQTKLAELLNCDARHIRRLIDLDHHSQLEALDDA